MDWSKVTRSQWFVVGGTAATVIGTLLLDWYHLTVSVNLGPLGTVSRSGGISAWDTGVVGKLAVLGALAMLAGVVLMFLPNPPELPVPLPMAMLVVSAFTALMAVFKFIDVHQHTYIGMYLTLIGGIIAAYGAYEMGGRFAMPSTSSSTQ
jgi:hypothetical protein